MAAQILEERRAAEITAILLGRRCWDVACGGSVGTTFQLALGRKLLRHPGVGKPRRWRSGPYEGEFGLLVWCSWRLASPKGPVTSSEDESPALIEGLRRLVGRRTCRVSFAEGWYLRVDFTGGLTLTIFPDHVGPQAIFDGNWEVWTPELHYSVGTDLECSVNPRQYPPSLPTHGSSRWRGADGAKVRK
jgi:hypothetical protein